jgi:hypothetical protein
VPPKPPAGQQVAQALMPEMAGNVMSDAQPQGQFPAAPVPSNALSMPSLYRALGNEWLSDEQRAMIQGEIERQQQMNDPLRQLQLQKLRREVESPQKTWQKLDDDTLFDPSSGEVKQIGGQRSGAFRFGGTSVEAQSLNGLMDANLLTPEQAMQLGAGKTVSGPNGEILFLTPQGVFGQPAQGGQPQPVAPATPASPSAPQQPQAGGPQPGQPGMIPLTAPKQTVDEKEAAGFTDRMMEAQTALSAAGETGQGWWGNIVAQNPYIPDFAESALMSGEFQSYDQARRNFINAQLRRESGAVISDEEFANANQQYFPQPGDTKEQVEQKREARETAIAAMRRSAGPAYRAQDAGTGAGEVNDLIEKYRTR